MRRLILLLLICFVASLSAFVVSAQEQAQTTSQTQSQVVSPEGKAAFLNQKCNRCHSILAEKVELTAGGYVKSKEKNVPPDLTGVGSKYTAEWLVKYVKRTETREGVKHAGVYRGSEDELKKLAKWLETLKASK